MERKIDSKYKIVAFSGGKPGTNKISIVNVYNGNEIPEDEPSFIFRAKDRLALPQLVRYLASCLDDNCSNEQIDSLLGMINEFWQWRKDNKDKMKQPGSTMPEDMRKSKEGSGPQGFGAPNDGD